MTTKDSSYQPPTFGGDDPEQQALEALEASRNIMTWTFDEEVKRIMRW